MILGSNLDGLPPTEHSWDLLAAAGGSQIPKSLIFDGFWLSSGVSWGRSGVPFWSPGWSHGTFFARLELSFLERCFERLSGGDFLGFLMFSCLIL